MWRVSTLFDTQRHTHPRGRQSAAEPQRPSIDLDLGARVDLLAERVEGDGARVAVDLVAVVLREGGRLVERGKVRDLVVLRLALELGGVDVDRLDVVLTESVTQPITFGACVPYGTPAGSYSGSITVAVSSPRRWADSPPRAAGTRCCRAPCGRAGGSAARSTHLGSGRIVVSEKRYRIC